MAAKQQHTSPEYLSHPGETLAEILAERGISQKELAIRTDVTEKHISSVISGKSSITNDFAHKLAIALNGHSSFWSNLQANYDFDLYLISAKNTITAHEREIAKEIKKPCEALLKTKFNRGFTDEVILELRSKLGVNNLSSITNLNSGNYRQHFTKGTNEYVMYAWQYLCERASDDQKVEELDIAKLKSILPDIKNIMFSRGNILLEIQEKLNSVGVLFTAQQHVKGAPVNGLSVKSKKGHPLIALTIRNKYRDIFWFTLFHEIAHIVNGDYNKKLTNEQYLISEQNANIFARNILIDEKEYEIFKLLGDFSKKSIIEFSKINNVLPDIVVGRLMNDKLLSWQKNTLRKQYEWAGNSGE